MSDPIDIHEDRDLEIARTIARLRDAEPHTSIEGAIWAALKQARREGRESVPRSEAVVLPLYRMAG